MGPQRICMGQTEFLFKLYCNVYIPQAPAEAAGISIKARAAAPWYFTPGYPDPCEPARATILQRSVGPGFVARGHGGTCGFSFIGNLVNKFGLRN